MIFQTLILQNFGPYGGRRRLNLRPDTVGNVNRPIILIGGLNGGGKTTLMDALRLVLYDQHAQCSTRGTLAYADFLNQCRNRQAGDDPTQLEQRLDHTLPTQLRQTQQHLKASRQGQSDIDALDRYLATSATEEI